MAFESHWADIVRSTDGDRANFLFVTPFAADPNQPGTLWTGGRYVYRRERPERAGAGADGAADRFGRSAERGPVRGRDPSEVGAVLWERASGQLLDEGLVSAIGTVVGRPGRVAAGATDGRVYVTDEGRSATESTRWDLAEPRQGWVTSVAFDPSNPDALYATYGGFGGAHVFRSANRGRTWRSIDGAGDTGIPDVPVHVLVVDPARPERLYLGTDAGVLVSDTGGDGWALENTGFGAIVTESLAPLVLPNGERWLFAFTHGRGAWKVRLSASTR